MKSATVSTAVSFAEALSLSTSFAEQVPFLFAQLCPPPTLSPQFLLKASQSIIWLHLDSHTSKLGFGHALVLPFATLLAFSFSLHSDHKDSLPGLLLSCLSTRLALSRTSPKKVFSSLRDCLCIEHFLGCIAAHSPNDCGRAEYF